MVWYNNGKCAILDGAYDGTGGGTAVGEAPLSLLNDIIKVALMKTTYAINIDTHQDFADVVASEIVATSYTSRGSALASKTVTLDTTNDRGEFDAVDLAFTIGNGANDTFDQIIVLREQDATATDANSLLLAHATVGSTTTNGGTITLTWNAEGILQLG